MQAKAKELLSEFRTVLKGSKFIDTILPPLSFILVNYFGGLVPAIISALLVVFGIVLYRLNQKNTTQYAAFGAAGVLIAVVLAWVSGKAEGFFVPSLISSGGTVLLCLVSLIIQRPLTALSSMITRRWPSDWYWHPKVLPAYMETTLLWTLFFALRFWWQIRLFIETQITALGWVNIFMGWPALIALLAITYLYGTWRLRKLGGPSIEEFKQNLPPPWQGQQQGF